MKHLQLLQDNVENLYKKRLDVVKISDEELLLSKVVLLDTELSEFMNEIEDHKLYKINKKQNKQDQLEELCDCIHVICSIANMLGIQLERFEDYNNLHTLEILKTYKKCKYRVNNINIARTLEDESYIQYVLEFILKDILAIAKAKEFTEAEIITSFVAVYAKNIIRAKGDY